MHTKRGCTLYMTKYGTYRKAQVANSGGIQPSTLFHLAPHLVSSPEAASSSHLTVKEQLHLYGPKSTVGPLKAAMRLTWPPVTMRLTPLPQS